MDTGYSTATTPVSGPSSSSDGKKADNDYWDVGRCKKAYLDYLFNKTQEIEEQKNARRYYHGAHWTAEQIKALKRRKQPVVTFNRIGRKIDGVVGLIERLRQDPKAYPRTPEHEQGADLATAVLRYSLDEEEWKAKSPEVARDAAIDGIGGVELEITQGDHGDNEVSFEIVEVDSFFYDPRSYRADFTDARFMGVGKWMDLDAAIELFPDHEEELRAVGTYSSELSSNPDREKRWFTEVGSKRLVRLIEIWYKHKGEWCYSIFTGYSVLMEGQSYFIDNKKKTFCKYVMFSANVDHDGDRYGFVRNMKDAQDEYNHRRSKALHQINSRRLVLGQGAVQDIETVRREWARPDGVVVIQGNDVNQSVKADDQSFDFAGQLKLMENAIAELENYGPNQALIGDQTNQSGRAIALLQQAGMAELGPYIIGYRGWKLRLYRALFNAIQKFWSGERWIRVTDDQAVQQFVSINQQAQHPVTGQPTVVNPIGSLDVDIILDEGPDYINAQQDLYETLSHLLPNVAPMLAPQEARAAVGILIDSSALPANAKKAFKDASQAAQQAPPPPNPEIEKAQIQLQAKQQENDQQLEFEKQKASSSMAQSQLQHEQGLQQKREQSALDAQLEREKMAMQFHHERKKLGVHVQAEREKMGHHVQTEREKAQIQRESNTEKLEHERATVKEAKRDPNVEKLAGAISEMAGGISKMAESIEEMGEKIAAPKKIVRDKSGNIVGAVPVETLEGRGA
jgi:hypothetical protein